MASSVTSASTLAASIMAITPGAQHHRIAMSLNAKRVIGDASNSRVVRL
jgi:hypothetical protein